VLKKLLAVCKNICKMPGRGSCKFLKAFLYKGKRKQTGDQE
jgi:hypothetical protein